MADFKFAVDQKYTIWERNSFIIEAETLEEAKEKLRSMDNNQRIECVARWRCEFYDDGYIYETAEWMEPSENDGKCTQEWICIEDDDVIFDNATNNDVLTTQSQGV